MGAEVWSEKTRRVLETAGWSPTRRKEALVQLWREAFDRENSFTMTTAAEAALIEFGGLRSTLTGPGVECASTPFYFDPTVALGEEDRFENFGRQVGETFFPLGDAYYGHGFLAIDSAGRIYLLGDFLALIADDIHRAIDALIVGRASRELSSGWAND